MTIERTALIVIFLLLFAIAIRVPVDTDTWWHIRSGEYTLTQGMIYADPFSFTKAGASWVNHSWGSQLVLYGTYRLLGDAGLALFQAVLAVGGLALLYRAGTGNVYLRGFVLILGAATASVFWSARPQMFSFFLNCALMLLLSDYKRGIDRLWLIPPLLLLWGNLHAGYSIGFLFLAGVIVGETLNQVFGLASVGWAKIRKLVIVTLIAAAVLLINPYGLDMLLVPFRTVGIGELRAYIQEWNSPNFQGRETWAFIFMVLALLGAAWNSRLKFDWSWFGLLGGTIFLALLYGRNIAVCAVVAVPLLTIFADHALELRGWVLRPRRVTRLAGLNAVLIGVVAFSVGIYGVGVVLPTTVKAAQAQVLPLAAVQYLNEELPLDYPALTDVRLFNSYNWGGYLVFAAPQYKVFIDGRTDLYNEFLQVYLDTALARQGWQQTLAAYGINVVLVENGSGLADALATTSEWRLAYQDELAVVYVR